MKTKQRFDKAFKVEAVLLMVDDRLPTGSSSMGCGRRTFPAHG